MTRKAKRIHDVDGNGSCTTKNHLPLELARAALGRGGKIRGSGRKTGSRSRRRLNCYGRRRGLRKCGLGAFWILNR